MELNSIEEFNPFINQNKLQAVAFVSTWCPPCKMLKPILYEFIEEFEQYEIMIVNTDNFKDIARNYDVTHVPQIFFFKEGKVIDKLEGFIDYDELLEKFEELF